MMRDAKMYINAVKLYYFFLIKNMKHFLFQATAHGILHHCRRSDITGKPSSPTPKEMRKTPPTNPLPSSPRLPRRWSWIRREIILCAATTVTEALPLEELTLNLSINRDQIRGFPTPPAPKVVGGGGGNPRAGCQWWTVGKRVSSLFMFSRGTGKGREMCSHTGI
jgi:hypothetical protein